VAEFLPPTVVVERAIVALPEARAASARVEQAMAEQRLRDAGPHEPELLLIPQRRWVDGGTPAQREYEVQLTRGLRWPNKARLDREIGTLGVDVATLQLGDAHHQGARRLLDQWMAWLGASAQADNASSRAALMQRERDAVATRVRLGDAAQRDLDLADANLARLLADALDTASRRDAARQRLANDFPRLPLPDQAPALPAPVPLDDPAHWQALIVERSHEIGAAVAEAQRMQRMADRARADRLPDPTIGLRYLNERSGAERALGVVVSIPLGVRARSARADADQSGADVTAAEAEAMRRSIVLGARLAVADAAAAQAGWTQLARASEAAALAARRSQRAYALGEAGVVDWLVAERQAGEAAMAEIDARVRAQHAWLRIQIDSHALWHVHDDEAGAD
jgi:outer membrane protein TolC